MSDDVKRGPDTPADDAEETAEKTAAEEGAAEQKPAKKTATSKKAASRTAAKNKPAATVKTKAVGTKKKPAAKADEPAEGEKKAPSSSEPLPEDDSVGSEEPVKEQAKAAKPPEERPQTEPPPVPPHYRSRHPQPPPSPAGGSGRVVLLVVAVIALVYVILSLANSRSYQIVEEGGQAVLSKGYFLPAGTTSIVPDGASTAFAPIPWITPPQGSVTRGNLREVSATYYALLYLAAGEAMEDDAAFDACDQQAAGLEAWYKDRYGVYPEATDKMHDLRFRVRNRRSATKEFLSQRDGVLDQIEALISTVPELASPAVLEDVARFQAFLEQERAMSF